MAAGMPRATSGARVGPESAAILAFGAVCRSTPDMVRLVLYSIPLVTLMATPVKSLNECDTSRNTREGTATMTNSTPATVSARFGLNCNSADSLIPGRYRWLQRLRAISPRVAGSWPHNVTLVSLPTRIFAKALPHAPAPRMAAFIMIPLFAPSFLFRSGFPFRPTIVLYWVYVCKSPWPRGQT